jgi:serine/threonine-protein kinase
VLELDGQPSGKAPGSFKTTLGEHKIAASLEGHEKLTRVVKLEKEGQHLRVVMALMALAKEAKDPQPNPNNPAPVRVAKGKLTLKTDPWTSVFLGKNKLGDTPLINFPLPAGKHLLRVVTEAGAESSIEVEIKPNDTTVKKLRL